MSLENDIDIVTDLSDGTADTIAPAQVDTSTTVDTPDDIRSLLNKAAADQASRERDPATGQFLSKKTGDAAPQDPSAPGAAPAPAVDPNAPPQAPGAAPAPVAAPASMPDAEKAQFAALAPEMQQYVARMAQGYENAAQQLRGYESITNLVDQRREAWALQGMTPEGAVSNLFALSDFAGRDPMAFVQWFAGQHGLDLATVQEGADEVDPQYAALQSEVHQLRTQLGQFQNGQQQQQHSTLVNEVQSWSGEKDAQGAPLRPHFDLVANDMMVAIQAVKSQNPNMPPREVLNAAYEKAVWSNPQSRALLLKAEADAKEAQRLTEARSKAGRAAGAAVSVTNSLGQPGTTSDDHGSQTRSLREELEYNFRKQS